MKNYSRPAATKGKTVFRTGDRWRARKNIVVRNVKSLHQWKNTLPNTKMDNKKSGILRRISKTDSSN